MRFFEAVSGQRMMTSYIRIGGVSMEPPLGLFDQIRTFLKTFPDKIDEYEGLLNAQPHLDRTPEGRWLHLAGGRDCAGRERASAARVGR